MGTGFGACFIVDGCYATYGPGVPIGGELWDYPFRGRIAEDFVSTRWFEEKFRQITGVAITGVKPMIDYYHADKYTAEVRAIFDEFARTFAEIMLPFVQRFGADTLVVGGGMVRAEEFFFPQLRAAFEQKGVQDPRWWRWPTRPPRSSPGRPRCVNNRTGQVSGYRPDNLRGVWLWFRLPHLTLGSQSLIPVLEYSS